MGSTSEVMKCDDIRDVKEGGSPSAEEAYANLRLLLLSITHERRQRCRCVSTLQQQFWVINIRGIKRSKIRNYPIWI